MDELMLRVAILGICVIGYALAICGAMRAQANLWRLESAERGLRHQERLIAENWRKIEANARRLQQMGVS